MHIKKNICESLMATTLNIPEKIKDTIKARLDLNDLGIKKELQFRETEDSCQMPPARYTLSKEQKKAFCDFLWEVKFPDGFASNISMCLNADGTKVQGPKTHDYHIPLQRILPAAMRGFLDNDIYEAIAELGTFLGNLSYPVFMPKPSTHQMHDPGSNVPHIRPKGFTKNQMS
jgi:hypothetical protein